MKRLLACLCVIGAAACISWEEVEQEACARHGLTGCTALDAGRADGGDAGGADAGDAGVPPGDAGGMTVDWVLSFGGAGPDRVSAIEVSSESGTWVTGEVSPGARFGGAPSVTLDGGGFGRQDLFLLSVGPGGGVGASYVWGGPGDDSAHALGTSSARLVHAGSFQDELNLGVPLGQHFRGGRAGFFHAMERGSTLTARPLGGSENATLGLEVRAAAPLDTGAFLFGGDLRYGEHPCQSTVNSATPMAFIFDMPQDLTLCRRSAFWRATESAGDVRVEGLAVTSDGTRLHVLIAAWGQVTPGGSALTSFGTSGAWSRTVVVMDVFATTFQEQFVEPLPMLSGQPGTARIVAADQGFLVLGASASGPIDGPLTLAKGGLSRGVVTPLALGAEGENAVGAVAPRAGGGFWVAATVGGPLKEPSHLSSSHAGGTDIAVLHFDERSDTFVSVRFFGGLGNERVEALAVDATGGVLVGGTHDGPTTLGGVTLAGDPTSASEAFILRWSSP